MVRLSTFQTTASFMSFFFIQTLDGAQTPEQRRRNAKFVKDQEARRGKSEKEIKQRAKDAAGKAPISPFWFIILAFVVFGGVVFEIIQRIFFR
ncbi:uncharacterized protein BCR38DRAFT_480459 [Pseudomassariella vexata]|uniref:Stress-associated endoplasmic reticulum protein n=1 Tax=Pseudomassariella vexata TaxID=1141098 RepID=A0A1Y2EKC3_9PEZI|nr:uncharacterized protein BCR38DRAFT_480459 [Pseudomassariella vexata]ORY71987.1 hypothetical protein BCR38DRAFT_480459 [Pseudomassariella vexata]